jgi:uncharacterized membrane protein
MSKLTIDDLIAAQQRNEVLLQEIATQLKPKQRDAVQAAVHGVSGLLSIVFVALGAYLAFRGNLVGVCVCLIALAVRIERYLMK